MLNRKQINKCTIQFDAFNAESGNKVGDHVEVSMGGPYTAKRFVISLRERHASNPSMITLTARAIETDGLFVLDPVASTIKRCGVVVADYVFDEVCNLHYIGENLEDMKAPYVCGDSAEQALSRYAETYSV